MLIWNQDYVQLYNSVHQTYVSAAGLQKETKYWSFYWSMGGETSTVRWLRDENTVLETGEISWTIITRVTSVCFNLTVRTLLNVIEYR